MLNTANKAKLNTASEAKLVSVANTDYWLAKQAYCLLITSSEARLKTEYKMTDISKNTQHIKQVLASLRKEQKLKKGLEKARVKELWEKLMSETIANYTADIWYNNGTLTVHLTSSALREELNRGKDKIIQLINNHLNENIIKRIVFK